MCPARNAELHIQYLSKFRQHQKQYVYKDENYIISRLEVTQNPKTIVDKNTKNILITIEGNEATSAEYIMEVASEIIDLITTYCGGKAQIIYK